MKPLLVGQGPSAATVGTVPFVGRSGARVAALFGAAVGELPRIVDPINLVGSWARRPGRKGDAFPEREARAAAEMVLLLAPHDRLILCGRKVAEAFGLSGDVLSIVARGGRLFLLLPHPSGVNLWWNDAENVDAARRTIREFVLGPSLTAVG